MKGEQPFCLIGARLKEVEDRITSYNVCYTKLLRVRLQSKLMSNMDRIPCCVAPPRIKPRYIDDVPILALTLWGKNSDHYMLRRVAAEVEDRITSYNVCYTKLLRRESPPSAGSTDSRNGG